MEKGTKWFAAVFGGLVLFGMFGAYMKQDQPVPPPPRADACSETAKSVSVMLAKVGYHVTLPTPSPTLSGAVSFGSTDMNVHTVEVVKAALRANHDLVLRLRAAGCKSIGFYGDKLGTFGADINLDDLP